MATASTCSPTPPPSFSPPLFGDSSAAASPSSIPRVPSSTEERLRALRKMSESGERHKRSPPPPPRRVSESALDQMEALMMATEEEDAGPFSTPRPFCLAPLETPPTPGGRRKRPTPVVNADELPAFLPVGIRKRAAKSSSSALVSPTQQQKPPRRSSAPTSSQSAPPSPKRMRTAPRYECPWLLTFAAADSAAAAAVATNATESIDVGGDDEGEAKIPAEVRVIDTLQDAAQMLEIGGCSVQVGRGGTEGAEGESESDEDARISAEAMKGSATS